MALRQFARGVRKWAAKRLLTPLDRCIWDS